MFGNNKNGQLGTGDTEDKVVPTNVMNNVRDISCGNFIRERLEMNNNKDIL